MAVYYPRAKINLQVLFDGLGSPDDFETLYNIDPASFTVHLNSYKEADTFEVTFDSKNFPFSPELIRSAEVQIYAYQAQDATDNPVWQMPENLLCVGLIDDMSLEQGADGGTVTMSGRDYTALMLDREWHPRTSGAKGRIPVGKPLTDVVQQLVDEATNASEVGRTLRVVIEDNANNARVSPAKKSKAKARGIAVKADSNYWDVIYKLCLSYGYIVFVRGFDVVISKPQVQQANALEQTHRVAYGRNLTSLGMERKMSKEAVPQVEVRSSADSDGRTRVGRFPERKQKVTNAVGLKKDEFKVFTVGDVQDESTLKEIAKTIYYTIARGEGEISFSTAHLADLPDENGRSRSMLALRAGNAVRIEWDGFNSDLLLNKSVPREEKISRLMGAGYDFNVANLVARHYDKLSFTRAPFYVREVQVSWDKQSGMTFDVTAQNFINVKANEVKE